MNAVLSLMPRLPDPTRKQTLSADFGEDFRNALNNGRSAKVCEESRKCHKQTLRIWKILATELKFPKKGNQSVERRLAAILAADVVGYTRLVGENETEILGRMVALRRDILEPLVAHHKGRIFKLTGDGILTEFASVTNAVECAISWQDTLLEHEADRSDQARLCYRIGVHLGEVLVDGDDLYGDGVNLAARLESIADPGGICVSDAVYGLAGDKASALFEDWGETSLKNIADPVHVYAISSKLSAPASELSAGTKASVAVLPFTNMSGDPSQNYFSDGIAEDITTELSRFRLLSVASRNASSAFKSDLLDIKAVGKRLGAQFVVEGSVRKAGNRVRISVQLVEVETGDHVWAEKYDRDLEDIFAVQDEVARSIVGVLPGQVIRAVARRATQRRPSNVQAYELVLQGKAMRDSFSAKATQQARLLFERATELDPHYGRAYSYLADTYFVDFMLGLSTAEARRQMFECSSKAMELDPLDVAIQEEHGFAYIVAGLWDDASTQFDRAIGMINIESEQLLWCAYGLSMLGRHEEALEEVLRAKSYDPLHPASFDWVLGQVQFLLGDYAAARDSLKAGVLLNSFAHACRTAAHAYLGETEQAEAALKEFVSVRRGEFADHSVEPKGDTMQDLIGGYRASWRRLEDWQRLAEGLRLAGLSE